MQDVTKARNLRASTSSRLHTSPSLCSRDLSADCCAVQDTGEAMDAAEDAADAVEHVADMAEDDDRPASQSSVGDVPIPKQGEHQLLTHSLPRNLRAGT